ncbi:MAG: PAS domain S-box protein [Thermodesulfobacteriota bacterium]
MAGSRFHELASDLTLAIRPRGKRSTDMQLDPSLVPGGGLTKSGSDKPQVIIYTRKVDRGFPATYMSDNVESQLGYQPGDFIDDPSFWLERIHPEDAPAVLGALGELAKVGHHVKEYRFLHKNGTYRWMRDEFNLVQEDGQSAGEILGTWVDVTELKRVEEALRQSEARYRSLVNAAPLGMISFDTTGDIKEFNPSVLRILGASSLGRAEAKDLFSLLPMVEAGISEAILNCLESGESGVGEFQYKTKSDRDVYTRVYVVPIKDGDGNITGAHAFIQDISNQKRAEELIVRSERLKVLGQISAGVGHNFNNLLQIVSGNANMALTNLDLKDLDSLKHNLEQILESVRSATETVRWLQRFGREPAPGTGLVREVFDLTDAVEEAIEVCRLWSKADLDRKKISITYEMGLSKGCYVSGVPDQINWVVLNLLKNAVEALPKGGKIRVKTYVKDGQAILKVRDNGVGIREEHLKWVAMAFWTSKKDHAGMGLTFNCEIIRKHGGAMGLKRMKPHGTTFTVRLPYVKDLSKERKNLARKALKKGLRILFIDDDEPIVRTFEKGMKLLGHKVYTAPSGELGLKLFDETTVDAVVCDLAMPGMNGWEVASAVAAACQARNSPKPPFIILTGWANPADEEEILAHAGVDRLVYKPIAVPKLVDIVKEELDKAGGESAFSGRVEGVDILEYMQLLMLSGRKVVLEIVSREGANGFIFIEDGEIRHAVCGEKEGEEALYRCLTFKGGSFSSLPWIPPERVTIDKPGMLLLVEAARKRDEMKKPA